MMLQPDTAPQDRPGFRRLATLILAPLAVLVLIAIIATPLDLRAQLLFGVSTVGFLFFMRGKTTRRPTLLLALLSFAISTRYIYWRTTETLNFDNPLGGFLGIGLYLAELYAWIILALGYIQTAWPLERKPVPLPPDFNAWPTVDIYIPTYNESLSVVGDTVLAALNIDYPADKMRVFLLDDGRRPEFRDFAAQVGCEYITRPDNKHAKAGNLNNAMRRTQGEYICIFDCDHVPTRAFLQLALGWLVKDKSIALVQTPHHFYSPEPFQRNTPRGRELPSEGALFYGAVQPGNDFWDAAFFCGSCAVIRRKALDDVGGFAGETVTEDAHSALKMQKLGWKTAYLNIPLAAGLATEKFALHIGQRIRWARGMTQIFRLDNPLFGGKMTIAQRLCYLNAILHFQFPLSRLVFLTSPLAYLFLGQSVIAASAGLIAAYALPHLIHNFFTMERLQGKYRNAFWGEVYEIALAFHLLRPTLLTLINPRKGRFNVTEKGELLDKGYFDWPLVLPHLIVCTLLFLGVAFGFARLYLWPQLLPVERGTLWLNTGWSVFNIVLLLAAVAVALETKQVRKHVRFAAKIPVTVHLSDRRHFETVTENVSMGGIAVRVPSGFDLKGSSIIGAVLPCGARMAGFPVNMVQANKDFATLRFAPMTLSERRDLVMTIMGRADAWIGAQERSGEEGVVKSWFNLLRVDIALLGALARRRPEDEEAAEARTPAAQLGSSPAGNLMKAGMRAAGMLLAVGLVVLGAKPAYAQSVDPYGTDPGAASQAGAYQRTIRLSLKELGAGEPVRLSGPLGEAGFPLTLRHDEIVTKASLSLDFSYAPTLIEEKSSLSVLVNGEPIGVVKLIPSQAGGAQVQIPINPILLLTSNRLNFRFVGHDGHDCESAAGASLWAQISNTHSALRLTVEKLPQPSNLARLPAPFFDAGDMSALDLPIVYGSQPTDAMLRASAVVASYFGSLASYRGFHFQAVVGDIPPGNAVLFATSRDVIPGLVLPLIGGPTLALVRNPADSAGQLLLVLGRSDTELQAAASALASGKSAPSGTIALVTPPALTRHAAYDAPRWLHAGREIALSDMPNAALSLQGDDAGQGLRTADFRVPPDLFVWPNPGAPLRVNYRYPAGDWLNAAPSRLDVLLNNNFLKSFTLQDRNIIFASLFPGSGPAHRDFVQTTSRVDVPPYLIFGQNQLQFYFDIAKKAADGCSDTLPRNFRTAIDADTVLDLTHAHHFAQLPNLAYFASAGFPFTRYADLSETAVVLSREPDMQTLSAFLDLMGRFGDATGTPVFGITIARSGDLSAVGDKDVLALGSAVEMRGLGSLFASAPVQPQGGSFTVRAAPAWKEWAARYLPDLLRDSQEANRLLRSQDVTSSLVSFRAPAGRARVVVALFGNDTSALPNLVNDLSARAKNAKVQGDLAVWTADGITSFAIGPSFWVGDLPFVERILWFLSRHPLLMAVGLLMGGMVLSGPIYWYLRGRARLRMQDGAE